MVRYLEFLETLIPQYLSCFNVNLIEWQKLNQLTWHEQEAFVDHLLNNNRKRRLPIRRSYELIFLKKLIQTLEANGVEIHDKIYEAYCQLNSQPSDDDHLTYKHYIIHTYNEIISLKESKSFVANGTTGLCSWQASLLLSNCMLNRPEVFQNKNILELGAGTGLCSLTAIKCCQPNDVVISDGSIKVLQLLNENLKQNFEKLKEVEAVDGTLHKWYVGSSKVTALHFPWEDVEEIGLQNIISPDIILAADVLYDKSAFIPLANSLDYVFKYMNNECLMFLAVTVRNCETVNDFIEILRKKSFAIEKVECDSHKTYFYCDNTIPNEIYCISKN